MTVTVIHHVFGGGSPSPASSDGSSSKAAAYTSGRANCARELADRAHRWIEEAMEARQGLTPEQRREAAAGHMEQAQDSLLDPKSPLFMTVVGRHAWTARILLAED